ncbi:puff II/9-2 protein-like isoform X2 [Scyliorhinus canicula]|uniref:puff II/9-2 protein-like isoform X2 n=1 Tax=Scyliorhinus canicula TaxID=7830 RepID=UPI0018F2CCA0|nr:puff II/9-2 protein-like isoform X2 [Scyliorhinus canicula]
MKLTDSPGSCKSTLKWLLLPLFSVTMIIACSTFLIINAGPLKQLRECRQQQANDSVLLNKCQEKVTEADFSLTECRKQSALKTESILKLEKLVNQLEILNRNLSIKQEQLEAEVLKWEEQTNQCKRSLTIVNDQLNTAKQDLKSCERDRDACRAQLNHTNTVQPHIVLIALLVTFLKLLYS